MFRFALSGPCPFSKPALSPLEGSTLRPFSTTPVQGKYIVVPLIHFEIREGNYLAGVPRLTADSPQQSIRKHKALILLLVYNSGYLGKVLPINN
jgi:hypothetical protein